MWLAKRRFRRDGKWCWWRHCKMMCENTYHTLQPHTNISNCLSYSARFEVIGLINPGRTETFTPRPKIHLDTLKCQTTIYAISKIFHQISGTGCFAQYMIVSTSILQHLQFAVYRINLGKVGVEIWNLREAFAKQDIDDFLTTLGRDFLKEMCFLREGWSWRFRTSLQ